MVLEYYLGSQIPKFNLSEKNNKTPIKKYFVYSYTQNIFRCLRTIREPTFLIFLIFYVSWYFFCWISWISFCDRL